MWFFFLLFLLFIVHEDLFCHVLCGYMLVQRLWGLLRRRLKIHGSEKIYIHSARCPRDSQTWCHPEVKCLLWTLVIYWLWQSTDSSSGPIGIERFYVTWNSQISLWPRLLSFTMSPQVLSLGWKLFFCLIFFLNQASFFIEPLPWEEVLT